ncbi:hypothetical protein [Pedobacter antarcticus]|uniref:hypothetical protein n=1 Tax=Pedobacter antarcticus TaxID=34086 RepID=UPI0029319FB6|nr:hypothetical protein [Pedobacter antarcticus]
MKTIEYFKLQAKNLHKDFKTQQSYFDPTYGRDLYKYAPKFFDVDALALDFDIDEDNFTLMNAQHYIARLAGFGKWTEILKASPSALELSKLLFDNMHKVSVMEWEIYISGEESKYGGPFGDEFKLDIFKTVFDREDGHQSDGIDYRLVRKNEKLTTENQIVKSKKMKTTVQIVALPLDEADRMEFIRTANSSFERVFERIEPENPELVRKMWNAEKFIDEDVLTPDRLPIDRDYALSMIDAFMVGYVIQLAAEADNQTTR